MVGRIGLRSLGTRILGKQCSSQPSGASSWQKLRFSTKAPEPPPIQKSSFDQPPLSVSLPGLPRVTYSSVAGGKHSCQITTLDNGLRIASENRFDQFCTVGVVIDSGSRYEVSYPSGISHFLEKLAFQSTTGYASRDKILLDLEQYGGICDSLSGRDIFIYATSIDRRGLDVAVKVLGEAVLRPQFTEEEVEIARQTINYELDALMGRPEQEPLLVDMIHAAAFQRNTLGLPKICPREQVDNIDRSVLFTYLKQHYTPKRMVIAAVGVDHIKLVEAVQKHFIPRKSIWNEERNLILPNSPYFPDDSIAQYTGGMQQIITPIPQYVGQAALPELAHVVIGLESCSHQHKDFIAICVLNVMMGGGSSFSAGGPGKGMFTRLYTNVLYRNFWVHSASAYNHSYADSGIFCIHASAPPENVRDLVSVMVREMVSMSCDITSEEIERAKKQLSSMLLMNLESRPVMFEDLGRQVLATGTKKKAEYFIKQIERISIDDIVRVAKNLLRTPVSVAARGRVENLPSLRDIQAALLHQHGKLPKEKDKMFISW